MNVGGGGGGGNGGVSMPGTPAGMGGPPAAMVNLGAGNGLLRHQSYNGAGGVGTDPADGGNQFLQHQQQQPMFQGHGEGHDGVGIGGVDIGGVGAVGRDGDGSGWSTAAASQWQPELDAAAPWASDVVAPSNPAAW